MGNTHGDVKSSATNVLKILYHQLGDVVVQLVDSSDINKILKESILQALKNEMYVMIMIALSESNNLFVYSLISYDPVFITRYQPSPSAISQRHSSSSTSSTKPIPTTNTNTNPPVESVRKARSEGLFIPQRRQGEGGEVGEGEEEDGGLMPAVTMSALITPYDISDEVSLIE